MALGKNLPKGTTFKLKIGYSDLYHRYVDKGRRIWIGEAAEMLDVGKTYLVTISDSKDEVTILPV